MRATGLGQWGRDAGNERPRDLRIDWRCACSDQCGLATSANRSLDSGGPNHHQHDARVAVPGWRLDRKYGFGISGTLPAFAATPTVTSAQATAASLNATVVGTGTFATQLTGATNNINNISGTVSLPTGAASSANQTNASQKTQIVYGSGNVIASTSNNLDVQCANCSGSGVSTADEATWTAGTSLFAGVGGAYQTTVTSNPLTTGHQLCPADAIPGSDDRLVQLQWRGNGDIDNAVQVSLANTGANATAVAVNPGTAANWGVVGQASTTSGQSGQLGLGAVTTSAPSYTTAQSDPLSLDTSGNLRVNCTTGAPRPPRSPDGLVARSEPAQFKPLARPRALSGLASCRRSMPI